MERVKGERGGGKVARERVRDKISNELSRPDVSLMRTAEIISGQDIETRAHTRNSARYTRLRCSLATRREETSLVPVVEKAGGFLACHPFVFP